jgi:ferrous iron transport protein B
MLAALAGQQNAGKSTLFNALTGVRQHIANYPGVTVEKKSGAYADHGLDVEVVDLPGTYSLTSFSLEERVARDFLLHEGPHVIIDVLDASALERGLPLTFHLIELSRRVVVALNMMDVAEGLGLEVEIDSLRAALGVPVVGLVGRRGIGIDRLRETIRTMPPADTSMPAAALVDYGTLEPAIAAVAQAIAEVGAQQSNAAARGLALMLLEGAAAAELLPGISTADLRRLQDVVEREIHAFAAGAVQVADHIIERRVRRAREIVAASVSVRRTGAPLSEKIDRVVLNRWIAPPFLLAIVWTVYELSIVQGYELTKITWPFLAGFRNWASSVLPAGGFLHDPLTRALGLWMVDSVNTLLNYVPIFLILFALIAILEDSGYMARIAFILDRVLKRFGLHGQSTLPLILAGVFAGGCAVPGVMATRAIPDPRARLATILTVPFMNCLAKVPLYALLIALYFPNHKGLILFYLSTITVLFALLIAKLLTTTVLGHLPTAPFVMELPYYHLPTFGGVLRRAVERTWLYVKKVGTIVVAVAAVIFVLLQFPGLSPERAAHYETQAASAISAFRQQMAGSPYSSAIASQERLVDLVNVYTAYRAEKLNAGSKSSSDAIDAAYTRDHSDFVPFLIRNRDAKARAAANALKKLVDARKDLRREMKDERLVGSVLGMVGRALEPVTRFAGFDWRINVALLSSFAARESSVATLGALFGSEDGDVKRLEERIGAHGNGMQYTTVTAVAVMLFFALYPPCLATMIMVRLQTGSTRWMLFSMAFPTMLGLAVAMGVQAIAPLFGADGLVTVSIVYGAVLLLALVVGLIPNPFARRAVVPAARASNPQASP